MNDDALVSVVVPVFDGEAYLRQSLESILAQTYGTLEVIVMDDASSDASAEIAAEFARADPRVRLRQQASNIGQFANVNAGLKYAQGEFVAVYHADDVYHPEIVAREVAYLRAHPDAAAVFTFAVLVDVAGHEFGRLDQVVPEIDAAELLHYPLVLNAILQHQGSFLPTPSALVRRDVYEELGPYALHYGLRGDLDMWLRIARRHPVGLIREHLLNYRVADHNESRRYSYLRTEPDLLYTVLDQRLADGDRSLAEPGALAAYEAHRAADLLLAARNAYVLGRQARLLELLGSTRLSRLVASKGAPRRRLLLLFALLHVLARFPHSAAIARIMRPRQTPPQAQQPSHARPEPKPL